jgi:hypothetical protein
LSHFFGLLANFADLGQRGSKNFFYALALKAPVSYWVWLLCFLSTLLVFAEAGWLEGLLGCYLLQLCSGLGVCVVLSN